MTQTCHPDAIAHWERIVANLKPRRWPPEIPTITIELTGNESADIEKFKQFYASLWADYVSRLKAFNAAS